MLIVSKQALPAPSYISSVLSVCFLLFSSSHSTPSPSLNTITSTLHLTTVTKSLQPTCCHHIHPLHFSQTSFTMQGSASYPAALGSSKWIASFLARHRYDDGIYARTSTSKSIPNVVFCHVESIILILW